MNYQNVYYESLASHDVSTDIIQQKLSKHYVRHTKQKTIYLHPFAKKEYGVATTYKQYYEGIITTERPVKLSTGGTFQMLIDILNDYTVGANIRYAGNEVPFSDEARSKDLLSKAVRLADTYGVAAIIQTEAGREVLGMPEIYYYPDENIFIWMVMLEHKGKMVYKYYMRSLLEGGQVREDVWGNDGKPESFTIFSSFTGDTPIQQLGVDIIKHNVHSDDWYGYSALDSVLADIRSFELVMDEYNKMVLYAKPRVHIYNDAVELDEEGKPNIDLTNDIYVSTEAYTIDDPAKMFESIQFDIKSAEYNIKMEDDLNKILTKVGLDQGVLAVAGNGVEKSAAEIASNDNRMYSKMEARKILYAWQLQLVIDRYLPGVELTFVPNQYKNFQNVVTQVSTLKGVGLISIEMAVNLLYPHASESEKAAEVERLNKEKEMDEQRSERGVSNVDTSSIQE